MAVLAAGAPRVKIEHKKGESLEGSRGIVEQWTRNQKMLKSLQRLALIQIANVRRSTPTAALELLYNVPPLDLHIWETALKTAVRLGISPNWVPGTRK